MSGSSVEGTLRVLWQDGLWRAFIVDARHPEGIEAVKSPDSDVLFPWAREYGAAHRLDVEVIER